MRLLEKLVTGGHRGGGRRETGATAESQEAAAGDEKITGSSVKTIGEGGHMQYEKMNLR